MSLITFRTIKKFTIRHKVRFSKFVTTFVIEVNKNLNKRKIMAKILSYLAVEIIFLMKLNCIKSTKKFFLRYQMLSILKIDVWHL